MIIPHDNWVNSMLKVLDISEWDAKIPEAIQAECTQFLEEGHILYFPKLAFNLPQTEQYLLSEKHADPGCKNISYHFASNKIWGVHRLNDDQRIQLQYLLDRFSRYAYQLVRNLFPYYAHSIKLARTSFRPIEIANRKCSYRKDDKRLHVDAFPSAPNQGQRILRVFSNINPHAAPRIWRIGEPFEKVAQRFIPNIKPPFRGKNSLLRIFKITKSYRTLYDHYMLEMHNKMKADHHYQKTAQQQEINFPAGSAWIVQTDHVSHAAMQGQYALEQTFYLPVSAMRNESLSPLRVLERIAGRELI